MDLRHVLDEVGSDDFDAATVDRVRRRLTGEFASRAADDPSASVGSRGSGGSRRADRVGRRGRLRRWLPAATAVAAVACIIAGVAGVVTSRPGPEVVGAHPTPTWQPLGDYRCGEVAVAGDALVAAIAASELDAERAQVLRDAAPGIASNSAEWVVGSQAGGGLLLLAPAKTMDESGSDVTFARIFPADAAGERTLLTGRCALWRDVPDGEAVAFEVAPGVDPRSTELTVTVETHRCAPRAEDYEVWAVTETADTVEVTVALSYRERRVEALCLPLEPAVFELTVELDDPVGERRIIDVGHASASEVFGADVVRIDPERPVAATVPEPPGGAGAVTCGSATITAEGLASTTTGDDLVGASADPVLSSGLWVDGDTWRLVEDSPGRVRVLHLLPGGEAELYEFTRLSVYGGLTAAWTEPFLQNCTLVPAG